MRKTKQDRPNRRVHATSHLSSLSPRRSKSLRRKPFRLPSQSSRCLFSSTPQRLSLPRHTPHGTRRHSIHTLHLRAQTAAQFSSLRPISTSILDPTSTTSQHPQLVTIPASILTSAKHHTPKPRLPSISFHQTNPTRYISRLLVLGTVGFFGYQYWSWKTGNKQYFEMLERLEQGDKTALDANPEYKARVEAEELEKKSRDDELRVPKLAKEFAKDVIERREDLGETVKTYEEAFGIMEKDYEDPDGELDRESNKEYLRLLVSSYDKLIMPSSQFLKEMTSHEAVAILRLTHEPSRQEIAEAYRDLMRINHPDVGGSPYIANKISTAKELLWENAPDDTEHVAKRERWEQIMKEHDDKIYNDQLQNRLQVIQRRRDIMEFRKKQWGTPDMNREPMVVENEASRRVHNLDFGILQMNRGEWPTITFAGWKPRVFRSLEEDERWEEYKKIKFELKHADIRREIERFQEMQQHDYDMIKFEQNQWNRNKKLDQLRPMVTHTWSYNDDVPAGQQVDGNRHWSKAHAHHIGEFKKEWRKIHYGEYETQRLFVSPGPYPFREEYNPTFASGISALRAGKWKRYNQWADPSKIHLNDPRYSRWANEHRFYPQQ